MDIRELADELVKRLRPGCERIAVAGSIRRGKANPKDIEIVCIPRYTDEMQELDLFGQPVGAPIVCDHLHNQLQELYANGTGAWTLDPDLRRNGPKYKRLRYWGAGSYCCDLFIVTAETWGNQLAIRTGPGDFSQALMTRALRLGLKQDGGRLWRMHRDGTRTVIDCPEEQDFFAALQVPYLEPAERSVARLSAVLA